MKKVIIILILAAVIFTGCNAVNENTDNHTASVTYADVDNEAIIAAANYMINLNSALNSNMHFIAIEYKCDVCDETKKLLMNAFSTHCSSVFDASSVNLADPKYSDENGTLRGIKITITLLVRYDNIHLAFTKKKSSVGSISSSITLTKNSDNLWIAKKNSLPENDKNIGLFKLLF